MKHKTNVAKNYDDILGPNGDPDLISFIEAVENLYPRPILPKHLANFAFIPLYDNISKPSQEVKGTPMSMDSVVHLSHNSNIGSSVFQKKQKLSSRLFWLPRRRLLLVGFETVLALTLVISLLIAVKVVPNPVTPTVAANNSSCNDGKTNQAQLGQVSSNPVAGTSTEIDQSQTLNEVTVTVRSASADANRIAIFVTVNGLPCFDYTPSKITLTNMQGINFPQMPNALGAGGGELLFDSSDIAGRPTTLQLHLSIASITKQKTEGGVELIQGPFNFDFNVPSDVSKVRIARLNIIDANSSVPVTLKKVVVTPSETRLYLQGNINVGIDYELKVGNILINNDSSNQHQLGTRIITSSPDGLTVVSLDSPLFNEGGEWSLTVRPHKYGDTKNIAGIPPTPISGGPWVFRFEVPSASSS